MRGKGGQKRKKDKSSPNSESQQENKRTMAAENRSPATPGMAHPMSQQTQFSQPMMPNAFPYTQYTPMYNSGSHVLSTPPSIPQPLGICTDDSVMNKILERLENMDTKLGQLGAIQSSINNITVKVNTIEQKVKTLETKVDMLETSRQFDSESFEALKGKQKEIDSLSTKMKQLERDQNDRERGFKTELLDMQCRQMRDNLLFYRIPEDKDETDTACVNKVLQFIEDNMAIENARTDIKLHRAHRIGKFEPTKTRPIVVKFAYYPDRERVRKSASKLRGTQYGVSQQFPKEIMETRRKLVPIMKQARQEGKDAYINIDKLYINKVLYKGPDA